MAILDGTIDRVIQEERGKMQDYLRDLRKLDITANGKEKEMIENIYNGMVKK